MSFHCKVTLRKREAFFFFLGEITENYRTSVVWSARLLYQLPKVATRSRWRRGWHDIVHVYVKLCWPPKQRRTLRFILACSLLASRWIKTPAITAALWLMSIRVLRKYKCEDDYLNSPMSRCPWSHSLVAFLHFFAPPPKSMAVFSFCNVWSSFWRISIWVASSCYALQQC